MQNYIQVNKERSVMKYKLFFFITISCQLYCSQIVDKPLFYKLLDYLPEKVVALFDPITPTKPSWDIKHKENATDEEIQQFLQNKKNSLRPETIPSTEKEKHAQLQETNETNEKIGIAIGFTITALGYYFWNR